MTSRFIFLELKGSLALLAVLFATTYLHAEEVPAVIAQNISNNCKAANCQLEIDAIKHTNGLVTRNNAILQISTDAKNLIFRTREEKVKTPVSYTYLGFYKKMGYHLVGRVHHFEDFDYLFISRVTGKITVMPNIPHPSVSGQYVAALLGSESQGPNQIIIWEVTSDSLVERYKYVPSMYALFSFKAWRSKEELLLTTTVHSDGTYPHGLKCSSKPSLIEVPQRLLLEQGNWKLENDSQSLPPTCGIK